MKVASHSEVSSHSRDPSLSTVLIAKSLICRDLHSDHFIRKTIVSLARWQLQTPEEASENLIPLRASAVALSELFTDIRAPKQR